jgi:transcriptional regulator with XRE-family HTH domain
MLELNLMEVKMTGVGERIRKGRQMNGLTQSQLASKLGCSINTISRWEHDRNLPSKKDMEKISSILGIDIEADEELSVHPSELASEDLRLELVASQQKNKKLMLLIVVCVVLFLIIMAVYILGTQKRSPDSPDCPVTIIYYDVQEGEEIN